MAVKVDNTVGSVVLEGIKEVTKADSTTTNLVDTVVTAHSSETITAAGVDAVAGQEAITDTKIS